MNTKIQLIRVVQLFLIVTVLTFASNGIGNINETKDGTSQAYVQSLLEKTNLTLFNPILGQTKTYGTGTFKGTLDGNNVKFFCIDLGHGIKFNEEYTDSGSTPSQITYILNNYYPYKALPYTGSLSVNQEAAAVQASIWHFSDSLDIHTISNNVDVKNRALAIVADANANHANVTPVKTLDIVPVKTSLGYGEDAKFVVEAYDINNNPAENVEIVLFTTGGGLSADTVYTNALGVSDTVTLTQAAGDFAQVSAQARVTIPQGTRYVHKVHSQTYQQLVLATPNIALRQVTADFMWVPEVDLQLTKEVDNTEPGEGGTVTYTVTVTNPSAHLATGVKVLDKLAAGLDFVSSVPANDYDEVTGVWNVGDVPANSSKELKITATVNYGAISGIPYNLGVAANYNLFVWQDLTQPSSDTEGRVAVGRNATLSNYSIGDKLPANSGDVFVVGRKVKWTSGRLYNGNLVYEKFKDISNQASIDGTVRKDTLIDWNDAKNYLFNLSSLIKDYMANGNTAVVNSTLELTGNDPFLNVFDVNGNDINNVTDVQISVPNGAVVLVNISGNNIVWSGGLHVHGTSITNVLYNFHRANKVTFQNIDITGSVLAPKAKVIFTSGVQNGQMMAKSVEGQGQFNNVKFLGNVPVDTHIPNAAEIIAHDQLDPDAGNNADAVVVHVNVIQNPNNGSGQGSMVNVQWNQVSTVTTEAMFWTIEEDANGNLFGGTWGGKILKSADDGLTWTVINDGMTAAYIWAIDFNSQGHIYAGTENGVWKSEDNGVTWNKDALDGKDVRDFKVDPNNDDIMYAGTWGYGVYATDDAGANWIEMNAGFNGTGAVHALEITVNGDVYAGTFDAGVYKYDFGSESWVDQGVAFQHIWDLNSTSTGDVYAATYGGGVYYTANNGTNWSALSGGLSGTYIYSVMIDNTDKVYVNSWSRGIYLLDSTPGAETPVKWANIGLNGYEVNAIFTTSDGKVYATTGNGEIYMADNVTSLDDNITEVNSYELSQNYPNPFNPSTKIAFTLKEAGNYSIKVYNILGQEVAEILNGQLTAGKHTVDFSAANLSSGLYIYRLQGNNVDMTKKMMLLK